ncbi:MAG: glycosyltransferase family 2 protein [Candidatus Paceibacterota bacterium]
MTFLENRRKIKGEEGVFCLEKYPRVTIIIPCWNEEKTVYKTIRSVFNLNYPKNKINTIIVDDGSTDNTWKVISKFSKYPNVKVLKKENGGKYTALNMGLSYTNTEFVGCLDADSVADENSLVRLMHFFEKKPEIMAVTPSIIIQKTNNIIERAQRAEYNIGVFIKKSLGLMGAIHVTPGPLTIYRKKVFDDLGPYRHAHNTEDMEIAYRMQKNHYQIEQCHDAYVYTNVPTSIKKLFKQRLRWIYGFLNNTLDYKGVLFRKKYGNFALFTLPMGIFLAFATCYILMNLIYSTGKAILNGVLHIQAVGIDIPSKGLDSFFINTEASLFLAFLLYVSIILSVIFGYKLAKQKGTIPLDIIYYFSVFSLISPFWLARAVFNTIISRRPSWR